MNAPVRHLPWIGGAAAVAADTKFSPLVSPIDETSASQIVESDAAIIDAAVKHAYGAYMKHLDATVAKRLEWLNAAADAIDKIEAELVRSLIRDIGKPRRAATFEAKRAGAFIRACAAQLPHINGEVLPLDVRADRRRPLRLHHAHSLWRGRRDHAVQRAGEPPGAEDRARASRSAMRWW